MVIPSSAVICVQYNFFCTLGHIHFCTQFLVTVIWFSKFNKRVSRASSTNIWLINLYYGDTSLSNPSSVSLNWLSLHPSSLKNRLSYSLNFCTPTNSCTVIGFGFSMSSIRASAFDSANTSQSSTSSFKLSSSAFAAFYADCVFVSSREIG